MTNCARPASAIGIKIYIVLIKKVAFDLYVPPNRIGIVALGVVIAVVQLQRGSKAEL